MGAGDTHRRARRARLAAVVLVMGVVAVAAPPATAAPGQSGPSESYVALGDSFTAGPLIPDQLPGPIGCLRSDSNYPHAVAAAGGSGDFQDVSCSGATTRHMLESHNVAGGPNPPQLDALDSGTDLVTLGIGGNDIGFASIIEDCVSLLPFGSPCQDRYVTGGNDEISARIAETAPEVDAVLAAIDQRAPNADVLVVGYPAIVPHTGSGCWPSLPMAWNDVPYLRSRHEELNAMLADRAAAHGATYVDVYTPSAGRDACASSGTRWVEPIVPGNSAAPVHPNARGMDGMATEVLAAR